MKKRILVHTCCAPCALGTVFQLQEEFDIFLYFYNPNIFPKEEFIKRIDNVKRVINILNNNYTINSYIDENYEEHKRWREIIKGNESLKENSERCILCYKFRLENSVKFAKENNFEILTTTLSLGPKKDAKIINSIGERVSNQYGIRFYSRDFKKNNGWNTSVKLSKEFNIYRQDYCGCEFSLRDKLKRQDEFK